VPWPAGSIISRRLAKRSVTRCHLRCSLSRTMNAKRWECLVGARAG
jgi:hypothetical protein